MIDPKTGHRRVLVLDTDGEHLPALETLEELLATLAYWEDEPDPELEPVRLPAPIAGGRALAALERVADALRASQGEHAAAAGRTGRLWARTVDRAWGMQPGSRMELAPLRIVDVAQDDVEVLAALAAALTGAKVDADVADAAEQVAAAAGTTADELYRDAAVLAGLLTAEWDDPVRDLAAMLADLGPAAEVDLTAGQAAVYRRVARRILAATGGGALDAYAVGAFE